MSSAVSIHTIFYVTTLANHFPSTRLTCNTFDEHRTTSLQMKGRAGPLLSSNHQHYYTSQLKRYVTAGTVKLLILFVEMRSTRG
jgi:hypothetical protein